MSRHNSTIMASLMIPKMGPAMMPPGDRLLINAATTPVQIVLPRAGNMRLWAMSKMTLSVTMMSPVLGTWST